MKKSGYSVRITCFIEASPTDMDQMRLAISAIEAVCQGMRQDGFQMVKHETRFMLSREVPEPADEYAGHDAKCAMKTNPLATHCTCTAAA